MKRRYLDALLWATAIVCIVAVPLAQEDPWLRRIVCDAVGCMRSDQAAFWNKLIYDFGVGTLISLIFYLLLVRLPAAEKRKRLSRALLAHYQEFKQQCIFQLMFASGRGSVSVEDAQALMNPDRFRAYFDADESARWYAAVNEFDYGKGRHMQETIAAMDKLRGEIDFTLGQAEIADDVVFDVLKNLSAQLLYLARTERGSDDIKGFFQALYSILGDRSFVGPIPPQFVEDTIRKI